MRRRYTSRVVLYLGSLGLGCAPGPASTVPSPDTVPTEPPPAQAEAQAQAQAESAAPEPGPATIDSPLYHARYGQGRPVVFLHGGPGYNSALFEATAAGPLAERYEVVVYDRAGCGRNEPIPDTLGFTFERAFADLDAIVAPLESPVLVAHSFGGALALKYLDARPAFSGTVVLVNAPISYQGTLQTIIDNCRKVYKAKKDRAKAKLLDQLEATDTSTAAYAGNAFTHGLSCGLYQPSSRTEHAKSLWREAQSHEGAKYFSDSRPTPFMGFHRSEQYTQLDLRPQVETHRARISAIYADEDRIISDEDRGFLAEALGPRYLVVKGAAHNVFVDQQPGFIAAVSSLVEGEKVDGS